MNDRYTIPVFACAAILLWTAGASRAVTPSFQGLGDLPTGSFSSRAFGVSADGSTVVGTSRVETSPGSGSSIDRAFVWTQATGMVSLGLLTGGTTTTAYAVNGDGTVVVGQGNSSSGTRGFRWTVGTGLVSIGDLPGGANRSSAAGVSDDGLLLVGSSGSTPGDQAFAWTSGAGFTELGDLPGGAFDSTAFDVSADGTVVVGEGTIGVDQFGSDETAAFLWTQPTGMVSIGDLPGGGVRGRALSVSANGQVVVGECWSNLSEDEAFRWTPGGGMQALGFLNPANQRSTALGVSGDGRIVVGHSNAPDGLNSAFIWTQAGGMRSLRDVLVNDYGLDLTGWNLTRAEDISGDGTAIVGYGRNPSNDSEAFLARIPALGCAGDVNGDGFTNAADFGVLASNFGASVTEGTGGDLNGDGIVNAGDFVILAGDFGCGS